MTTIKHHIHITSHSQSRVVSIVIETRIAFHTQTVSSRHRITRCHNSNTADDNCRVIYTFPLRIVLAYKHFFHLHKCLRPYHQEYIGSRLITEVKPGRAGLVLGWVTAWEYPVS